MFNLTTIRKSKLKIIVPIFVGTIIEWYDFSVFGFLTPILSQIFFKHGTKISSSIMMYAVFAIGFIVRPIGALFFGQLADRFGRKKSMLLSMKIITIATCLMGLLPDYETLGMLAPLIMLLLRLIQGFCIGGESSGAALYILEMYPMKSRGMLCSFMWSAVGFGMLAGSAMTSTLLALFSQEQIIAGWWRMPLLFSVVASASSLYFRKNIPETMLYLNKNNIHKKEHKNTFKSIVDNRNTIISIILLYALSSTITYIIFIFMPFYVNHYNGINFKTGNVVTTIALSCVTFLVPISGYISDRIGRKICLYIGSIGFMVISIPLYIYMEQQKTILSFIISDFVFVVLAIIYQGALTASVQESITTNIRFTVTSIGYNISYGFFGGTAPFMVSWISGFSKTQIIPGIYLTFFAFLSFLAVLKIKETFNIRLE